MDRKIYCRDCGTYVGTIRDAKLMKGLSFICPSCDEDKYPNYSAGKSSESNYEDWGTILGNMFKK